MTSQVYFDHFLSHTALAPLAKPGRGPRLVNIIKTEEKGSDVNLAVHLLNDGWTNAYDCAIVVTNDSDIAEAMRLVKEMHKGKQRELYGRVCKKAAHFSTARINNGFLMLLKCENPSRKKSSNANENVPCQGSFEINSHSQKDMGPHFIH